MSAEWDLLLQSASLPIVYEGKSKSWRQVLDGDYHGILENANSLKGGHYKIEEAASQSLQAWLHSNYAITKLSRAEEGQSLLQVAIAALLLFLQANLTGPDVRNLPEDPLLVASTSDTTPSIINVDCDRKLDKQLGEGSVSEADRWALADLESDGETVEGKFLLLQYLVLAKYILLSPLGLSAAGKSADLPSSMAIGNEQHISLPETWTWWAHRLLFTQQRILSGPSASLRESLQVLHPKVQKRVADTRALSAQQQSQLQALLSLEAAFCEHYYRVPGTANDYLLSAQQSLGFTASLSGALGIRTTHQQEAKAQLTVRCEFRGSAPSYTADKTDAIIKVSDTEDTGDILSSVKLEDSADQRARSRGLSPLEQSTLMALGEQIRYNTAKDEMQPWQIVAFANAVLNEANSRFILQLAASISRLRFERSRSRTKQRALVQMEQVIQASRSTQLDGAQRAGVLFSTACPLYPALEREYGEQLVGMGMVGEAMGIFERLELWDSLLVCYQLLNKNAEAISLIQTRLKVTPDDSRLLCALGDVTQKTDFYLEAWNKSKGRSGRAQRSLGRMAMAKQEYDKAADHWSLALGINPLHPDGWFALGYCCMKLERDQKAIQAFTKTAQQQPENGDAWNNIAALCMKSHKYKEAFTALKEAVKFKRDSWQTWSNYAEAAYQAEMMQTSVSGLQQVGHLTSWGKVDLDLLGRLVESSCKPDRRENPDQRERIIVTNGLKQILKSVSTTQSVSPVVWSLIASFNLQQEYVDAARDALRKFIRATAGTSWKTDVQSFRQYAAAIDQSLDFALGAHGSASDLKPLKALINSISKTVSESVSSSTTAREYIDKWQAKLE